MSNNSDTQDVFFQFGGNNYEKDASRNSFDNPEFLSTIPKRKEVFTAEIKNQSKFEWVKVKTYPKLIDGKWAFETLFKKVYH